MSLKKIGAGAIVTLTLGAGGVVAVDKAVDPYLDEGTHYELAIVSDIPQGERVEISKTEARMDLIGWNDEYRISIKPQIPTTLLGVIDRNFKVAADRPLLSKRMEFKSGDVTAFIEPKSDNEFDIDFTLAAKPDTNVFEYKIEGAEGFDFWYQPELTAEEIAEGADRPENVVGSYAVYHSTKTDHEIFGTNYATGKAFHIYRPKAIDANGVEMWAELAYANGLLSVTVPQKFLDDAVYPVRVDPTFGYTAIGGTSVTLAGNTVRGIGPHASPDNGTLISLSIYDISPTASGAMRAVVYASSTLALIDAGIQQDVEGPGWLVFDLDDSPIVSGTNYLLGFWIDATTFSTPRYDVVSGINISRDDLTYHATNDPNNPFVVDSMLLSRKHSIYATYCTSSCSHTYDIPGTFNWVAPSGVTSVDVACWGAGGGGGVVVGAGGGGGGGGAYAKSTVTVTPGTSYPVVIPAGASLEATAADATFNTTTVVADGGAGAVNSTAGAGGTTAASTGDIEFAGGAGANGETVGDNGGGAGGAGGPDGAGADGTAPSSTIPGNGGAGDNGSGGAGGTGVADSAGDPGDSNILGGGGGSGGDGEAAAATGGAGGVPGGGHGGQGDSIAGGLGGNGQCTITYTASGGAAATYQNRATIQNATLIINSPAIIP